ncbi:HAD-like domain-containing protein, partial [Pseudomassariella vexata]
RDIRTAPSPASGGVPNPTSEYIQQASLSPTQLPEARRILVVIDLNGTLLYRPNLKTPSKFTERPHARTFLDYCIRTFKVAIWSSARPPNVHKMLLQLLTPEQREQVVAVWARDTLGLTPADYSARVQVYKRLEKLWQDPAISASHPEAALGRKWDQTNTVLVDDSVEKARSQPFNLIGLPEFKGNEAEYGHVLPQVHDFLNECTKQRDVSCYIRSNPFVLREGFSLEPPP